MKRRILLAIVYTASLTLGVSIPSRARQNPDSTLDLYEANQMLLDSLRTWSGRRPNVSASHDTVVHWRKAFSGYDLTVDTLAGDTLRLRALLPAYMGLLTTEVEYLVHGNSFQGYPLAYVAPLEQYSDTLVYDQSTPLTLPDTPSDPVLELLKNRFQLYRTLSLPSVLQPPVENVPGRVRLYYHAREVDSLDYASLFDFIKMVRRLAVGYQVWAGPVDITTDSLGLKIQFYVLISKPEARGHHFLLISEFLTPGETAWVTQSITVHFFPYLRTDNLWSVFGEYSGQRNPQALPVPIKKR